MRNVSFIDYFILKDKKAICERKRINFYVFKAIKFWPDDIGIIANYALVFAQLLIKGQNHGVHVFLC